MMSIGWIIFLCWYLLGMLGSGMAVAMLNYNRPSSSREKSEEYSIISLAGPIVIGASIAFYYMVDKQKEGLNTYWVWNKWW